MRVKSDVKKGNDLPRPLSLSARLSLYFLRCLTCSFCQISNSVPTALSLARLFFFFPHPSHIPFSQTLTAMPEAPKSEVKKTKRARKKTVAAAATSSGTGLQQSDSG